MLERYFVVLKTNENIEEILKVCMGSMKCIQLQRTSLDETTIVVMLPPGDTEDHPCLNGCLEYNGETIVPILDTDFWRVSGENV